MHKKRRSCSLRRPSPSFRLHRTALAAAFHRASSFSPARTSAPRCGSIGSADLALRPPSVATSRWQAWAEPSRSLSIATGVSRQVNSCRLGSVPRCSCGVLGVYDSAARLGWVFFVPTPSPQVPISTDGAAGRARCSSSVRSSPPGQPPQPWSARSIVGLRTIVRSPREYPRCSPRRSSGSEADACASTPSSGGRSTRLDGFHVGPPAVGGAREPTHLRCHEEYRGRVLEEAVEHASSSRWRSPLRSGVQTKEWSTALRVEDVNPAMGAPGDGDGDAVFSDRDASRLVRRGQ